MCIRKITFIWLCSTLAFFSCSSDDDGANFETIPPRDRAEQQLADNDSILKFLRSHYFNKSKFLNNSNPKIADLRIIEADASISASADSLLINAVDSTKTQFDNVHYTFYTLKINGGGGKQANFSSRVRAVYEGRLLQNYDAVFDKASTPVEFNLVGGTIAPNSNLVTGGTIIGWQRAFPLFRSADSFQVNPDGTVNFNNAGVGVMFLPSGLAYFNRPPLASSDNSNGSVTIPQYAPLIFNFEFLQGFDTDFDNDGVPSFLEDRNGNGEFPTIIGGSDLEDDTDKDGLPDYLDTDDDGDGVLTIDEDFDNDGDPTNDMSPINPDKPRYLDPDIAEKKPD